jgi:diguanylate cyclase (GGDEF)-like protein
MVDTKEEGYQPGGQDGQGGPGGRSREARPDRFRELENEITRLQDDRDGLFRAFKPLLQVAAIALCRERESGKGDPDGREDLEAEVSGLSVAITKNEAELPDLSALAGRLAAHFRTKDPGKVSVRDAASGDGSSGDGRSSPELPGQTNGQANGQADGLATAHPTALLTSQAASQATAKPPQPSKDPSGPDGNGRDPHPGPEPLGQDSPVCERGPDGEAYVGFRDPAFDRFRIKPFSEFLKLAAAVRGGSYQDRVRGLEALVRSGDSLELFAETLSKFLVKLVSDMRRERQEISVKLSTIIRTLVNLENEFRDFLEKSIDHIGGPEQLYNATLSQRVEHIQEMIAQGAEGDPDSLMNLITEEMEHMASAIRHKTEEDGTRLVMLRDERNALESSLDTVRRDYDSFVRQSRQMLREIEEMRSIALRDGLTKVFNRRAYDEQLLLTLLNYKSGKLTTFTLVIFDIDHFRDVNNNYGHQAGDRILVHLALTVTSSLRSDDFVFRYGGDEFVLILPGAGLGDGLMVAEKIRRAIENTQFVLTKGGSEWLSVTVSMGVAETRPGDTPGSILARADRALYASKRAGRNRVTAAPDDMPDCDSEGE